jgi:hypothetical protein
MTDVRIMKQILQYKPKGNWDRGRAWKIWNKCVKSEQAWMVIPWSEEEEKKKKKKKKKKKNTYVSQPWRMRCYLFSSLSHRTVHSTISSRQNSSTYDLCDVTFLVPILRRSNKNSPTVTHGCRKRRLKWVATLPLRDITNTEVWSSGRGLGVELTTLPCKKENYWESSKKFSRILWRRPRLKLGCGGKERRRRRRRRIQPYANEIWGLNGGKTLNNAFNFLMSCSLTPL